MTAEVILSLGSVSVDLTSCGVSVTHRFNNPIIVIDTPRTNLLVSNSVGINIRFVSEAFDMKFTLTDGLGTLNWATPITNYEKLFYFGYKANPKMLRINGRIIYGHIESLSLPWEGGKKDISNGFLSFRVTKNIEMEQTDWGDGLEVTFTNGSPWIGLAGAQSIFASRQKIQFTTDGVLPANFSESTDYWVWGTTESLFGVSATNLGDLITAGSAGSGTHKVIGT
jgi:hypothetical protein